jgi:hypothetical protein
VEWAMLPDMSYLPDIVCITFTWCLQRLNLFVNTLCI